MNKFFLLIFLVSVYGCSNFKEFAYIQNENEDTTSIVVEDTYAPNFLGIPIFTRYWTDVRLFDGEEKCPFDGVTRKSFAEVSGYRGKLKLTQNSAVRTINIPKNKPTYISIYRQKDITNRTEWCSGSYRLDAKEGKKYHIKFEGKSCGIALYEITADSPALIRSDDLVVGQSGDERICIKEKLNSSLTLTLPLKQIFS